MSSAGLYPTSPIFSPVVASKALIAYVTKSPALSGVPVPSEITVACSSGMSSGAEKVAVDAVPTSPVTWTALEASPEAARASHRSTAALALGDAEGAGAPPPAHPASRSTDATVADKAAIGRRRTENLTEMG